MNIKKTVSAIQNNVVSGLPGLASSSRFSLEQIEDDVIEERLLIIKEYSAKNLLPVKDLVLTLDCIPVGCKSITNCCIEGVDPNKHFEIPQVLNDWGMEGIQYIGSVDRQLPFSVYTDVSYRNHKHRRRRPNKPFVWINTTPNENGLYDGYIFNAPLIQVISISAVFKDPRQLEEYACCNEAMFDNKTFIDAEVQKRLTEKYIRYYRQMATSQFPNNQIIK